MKSCSGIVAYTVGNHFVGKYQSLQLLWTARSKLSHYTSPGSDVSMQTQLVSVCTHSLFLCAHEPVCAISLDLELLLKSMLRHCQGINFFSWSYIKTKLIKHQSYFDLLGICPWTVFCPSRSSLQALHTPRTPLHRVSSMYNTSSFLKLSSLSLSPV